MMEVEDTKLLKELSNYSTNFGVYFHFQYMSLYADMDLHCNSSFIVHWREDLTKVFDQNFLCSTLLLFSSNIITMFFH